MAAAAAWTLHNLFHTADVDTGSVGEGRDDGVVHDTGGCGGQGVGGVRREATGDVRPNENREMREVIRNTVKFTKNPEGKQDNAECVAAGKYKREDGEAFLRPTGSLVDFEISRMVFQRAPPQQQQQQQQQQQRRGQYCTTTYYTTHHQKPFRI